MSDSLYPSGGSSARTAVVGVPGIDAQNARNPEQYNYSECGGSIRVEEGNGH
ncbi:hypothetical protein ACFFQF_22050 [Haladaptatus pallidirubidus]|uniref:Uncharacterized protein n=1 Tax=Haladaptatus pallidirubidus TaxID=1008152 RepID=A0AAV3UIL0_9EURY